MNRLANNILKKLIYAEKKAAYNESVQLMKKRKMKAYAAEDEDFDATNARSDKAYILGESKDVLGLCKTKNVNKQKALGGRRNTQNSAQFNGDYYFPYEKGRDESTKESTRNADVMDGFYGDSYTDMHKHANDWIEANDAVQKKYAKKFKPIISKDF